jgi:chemotaxis protein methyltransferase CheR
MMELGHTHEQGPSRSMPMFWTPTFYQEVRARVVPFLRTYPSIAIWWIGCGTGEPVYALAIALAEEGVFDRMRIYGTDTASSALARARGGVYTEAALEAEADLYRRAGGRLSLSDYYAVRDGNAVLRSDLRERIVFAEHNIATDASFHEFQLVVCRDVLQRLAAPLQSRLFDLVDESLCTFGILALGRGDSLRTHTRRERYLALESPERLFRKVRP